MNCDWQAYLNILPPRLRSQIDKLGKDILQDTRLRIQRNPILLTSKGNITLPDVVTADDLQYCINAASQYSPWAAKTISEGFITAYGGHRIGLCGSAVVSGGNMTGMGSVTSLAIRTARDFVSISKGLEGIGGSILILGSPGTGKTTLLRDLIRQKSRRLSGSIAVVDERQEVFPHIQGIHIFDPGENTDILSGCPKRQGISMVLRTMGPSIIALDEITHTTDCEALIQASWCGVDILATAHAKDKEEYYKRPVYKPLVESGIFQTLVILRQDKTWYTERVEL